MTSKIILSPDGRTITIQQRLNSNSSNFLAGASNASTIVLSDGGAEKIFPNLNTNSAKDVENLVKSDWKKLYGCISLQTKDQNKGGSDVLPWANNLNTQLSAILSGTTNNATIDYGGAQFKKWATNFNSPDPTKYPGLRNKLVDIGCIDPIITTSFGSSSLDAPLGVLATADNSTATSCLPVNDPSRLWTQSRTCRGYSSTVQASDCGDSYFEGFNTYDPGNDITHDNWCGPVAPPAHYARCYKNPDAYPQDLDSRLKCCRGVTEQRECDPRYCPGNKDACRSVLAQYCSQGSNINNAECGRLFDADPQLYKETVAPYCLDNNPTGSHFNETACKTFCSAPNRPCASKLLELCASKLPDDPVLNSSVCGCSYPEKVYKDFTDELATKWVVPLTAVSGPKACTYPLCQSANAAYQSSDPKDCPLTSITTCLQNIVVDNTGAIVKGSTINITQSAACQSTYTQKGEGTNKCASDKDCLATQECKNGFCVAKAKVCTAATATADCASNEECVGKICVLKSSDKVPDKDEDKPDKKKFPVWAIVLIILGVVLLLGSLGYFLLRPTKSTTTVIPIVPKSKLAPDSKPKPAAKSSLKS